MVSPMARWFMWGGGWVGGVGGARRVNAHYITPADLAKLLYTSVNGGTFRDVEFCIFFYHFIDSFS